MEDKEFKNKKRERNFYYKSAVSKKGKAYSYMLIYDPDKFVQTDKNGKKFIKLVFFNEFLNYSDILLEKPRESDSSDIDLEF